MYRLTGNSPLQNLHDKGHAPLVVPIANQVTHPLMMHKCICNEHVN